MAIVSLFVNFQVSRQKNIRWKFFNNESNGLCRVLKSHIFYDTRLYSNVFAGKEFGGRPIIELFGSRFVRDHHRTPCVKTNILQVLQEDALYRRYMVLTAQMIKARRVGFWVNRQPQARPHAAQHSRLLEPWADQF